MSPRHRSLGNQSLSPPLGSGDSAHTCLFLPYLHFDSYKKLLRRRDTITRRLSQGRAHPVPETVAKSDSLEVQVIWEYLGHDPPINCRRTLDQYGYPSLRDTRSRDDDQMLYKLTKERTPAPDAKGFALNKQGSSNAAISESGRSERSSGSSWRERLLRRDVNDEEDRVLNGNVLMVDQLWLWVIQSRRLAITNVLESNANARRHGCILLPQERKRPHRRPVIPTGRPPRQHLQRSQRRPDAAVRKRPRPSRPGRPPRRQRAARPPVPPGPRSIPHLRRSHQRARKSTSLPPTKAPSLTRQTERLTSSLKEFRSQGFRDKALDHSPVQDGARTIRKRHKEEGRRAERDNRDNTSALLELRDMEDELQTLLHLFERQSRVVASMHAAYSRPELRERAANGRAFLAEALARLREYARQAGDMARRARSTRDDYDKLLSMAQRQAQVDEVRLSRLHADLASAQSRSVMIFTTFTVIFLPLTFFTGLFGMNTREWGGENNLSLETIGMIAVPSSAVLVLASLVIAFSSSARRFFRWVDARYRHAARRVYFEIWGPVVVRLVDLGGRVRRRRKGGDEEGPRRRRKLETEVSDFWERNRPEREGGYRIPEVNRRRVRVGDATGTAR